jgi:hypothetical protein
VLRSPGLVERSDRHRGGRAGAVGFGGAAARGMHYLAAMRNITEQGEATRPCLAVRDSGGGVASGGGVGSGGGGDGVFTGGGPSRGSRRRGAAAAADSGGGHVATHGQHERRRA